MKTTNNIATYTMPGNLYSFVAVSTGLEIVCVRGKCRAMAIRRELDASGLDSDSQFQALRALGFALRTKYPRGFRG